MAMNTYPNILFDDWEAEQLRDLEFRAAVKKLEPIYQMGRLWHQLAVLLWRGTLPRFFYIADARGRVAGTRPAQEFAGLEKLIRTR